MSDPTQSKDEKGNAKVQCKICGAWHHRLEIHVSKKHAVKVAEYRKEYPGASTLSEYAKKRASKSQKRAARQRATATAAAKTPGDDTADGGFKIGAARVSKRDPAEMDDLDRAKIPIHDPKWIPGPEETEMWEAIGLGVQMKRPVYLGGPTGCGKTSGVMELAMAMNQPVHRFQLHLNYKVSKFLGFTKLIVDEKTGQSITEWVDGPFTVCVRRGWWALLDEFDRADAGILMALQAVMEGAPLIIDDTGEVIEPHENFRIIATGNTMGRGDDTGMYSAARVLDEATMDRFGVVYLAGYSDADTEIVIVRARSDIPLADARKMVEIARKVRTAFEKENCHCTFSRRTLIEWSEIAMKMGGDKAAIHRACKLAVLNRLDGSDRVFISELVQRYFGGPS